MIDWTEAKQTRESAEYWKAELSLTHDKEKKEHPERSSRLECFLDALKNARYCYLHAVYNCDKH